MLQILQHILQYQLFHYWLSIDSQFPTSNFAYKKDTKAMKQIITSLGFIIKPLENNLPFSTVSFFLFDVTTVFAMHSTKSHQVLIICLFPKSKHIHHLFTHPYLNPPLIPILTPIWCQICSGWQFCVLLPLYWPPSARQDQSSSAQASERK